MSAWPDGRGGAVSVTFDNLGEAAELEMGLRDADEPLGEHESVTRALPRVLELLDQHGLRATFFVEGLNAELYPGALRAIAAAGHEVGFHAWRHEEWSGLGREEEERNLGRGAAAMRAIGVEPTGFRPPGGLLSDATLELLEREGFAYCSPAGEGPGLEAVAVLPFAWPEVDAFHVLPPFGALREHLTGDPEPGGRDAVRGAMLAAVAGAAEHGGHRPLVLHTWMIEYEDAVVSELLAEVRRRADAGELWAARCDEVADWVRANPRSFTGAARLDGTSWMSPS